MYIRILLSLPGLHFVFQELYLLSSGAEKLCPISDLKNKSPWVYLMEHPFMNMSGGVVVQLQRS
jgi:uncharacterized membrane protein